MIRPNPSSGLLMSTTCESATSPNPPGEPLRSSFGDPDLLCIVEHLEPDPGHDVPTRSLAPRKGHSSCGAQCKERE